MGLGKTVEVLACILNHAMEQKTKENKLGINFNEHAEKTTNKNKKNFKETMSLKKGLLQFDSFTAELPQESNSIEMSHKFYHSLPNCTTANIAGSHERWTENDSTDLAGKSNTSETDFAINDKSCSKGTARALNDNNQTFVSSNDCQEKELESGKTERQSQCLSRTMQDESSLRCICGERSASLLKDVLKCSSCGFTQHSLCIGSKQYFRENWENYVCPECVVKMVSFITIH